MDSPDGGPPRAGIPWVLYAFSGAAAVVAIVDFLIGVSGHRDKLTGAWLFLAMISPLALFAIIIGYQARRFSSGLMTVTRTFAAELKEHVVASAGELEGLRGDLNSERAYVELVRGVSTAARSLSRQVTEHDTSLTNQQLGIMLRHACQDISRTFSASIGHDARVCVKQLTEQGVDDQKRAYVKTVCRSNHLHDDDLGRLDAVEENTDFDVLFTRRQDYWFSSNIDIEPGYKNSSRRPWSYKSVIVWPIIARTGRADVESQSNGYDVAAFLCVDSALENAFSEDRDVPLGWALADAMGKAYEAHYLTFQ